MDLASLIEGHRFVGQEFLVWLWFESELYESEFEPHGVDGFRLWLETSLSLEAHLQEKEQSKFRGLAPSATPEAREGLRIGKLPTQARIRIERGEQQYGFVFTAQTLALSSVTIPTLMQDDEEERFYERMYLIEQLEAMVGALYSEFLAIRLSPLWQDIVVPAIYAWIHNELNLDIDQFRDRLKKVAPLGDKRAPVRDPHRPLRADPQAPVPLRRPRESSRPPMAVNQ